MAEMNTGQDSIPILAGYFMITKTQKNGFKNWKAKFEKIMTDNT